MLRLMFRWHVLWALKELLDSMNDFRGSEDLEEPARKVIESRLWNLHRVYKRTEGL